MNVRHIYRHLLVGLLIMGALHSHAQDGKVRKGDKYFLNYSFADAAEQYEEAALQGADPTGFARRLAMSYWKMRELGKAEHWFMRTATSPKAAPVDLYHYSEVLRGNGKFEEADQWMKKYHEMVGEDSRYRRQMNAAKYAPALRTSSLDKALVTNVGINSDKSDMGPTIHGGRLYFASSQGREVAAKRRHSWNGQPFLDLYSSKMDGSGSLTGLEKVAGVNTSYHESNATFSPDGRTMYFTRNNFHRGKKQLTSMKVNNLKIYTRSLEDGAWVNEQEFPYNSNEYSVAHPCLSADGNTLYFTSDMPGRIGGTDIWMCTRNGAAWDRPVNLGTAINTEGNEMFPFIHPDGTLFFASDGQAGLGGLDNVYARASGSGLGAVKNPGAPINSGADDFGLVLDATSTLGYFTSNRSGGKGDDDIYMLKMDGPFAARQQLQGFTYNAINDAIIPNTTVYLLDEQRNVVDSTRSDDQGSYVFTIEPDGRYMLDAKAGGFMSIMEPKFTSPEATVDTMLRADMILMPKDKVILWYHVQHGFTSQPLYNVKIDRLDLLKLDQIETAVVTHTNKGGDHRELLEGVEPGDSIVFYIELSKEGFYPKKGTLLYLVNQYGEVEVNRTLDLCLFPIDPIEHRITCDHNLDRSGLPLSVGRDLNEVIEIDPIYFDLNKHDIRPDAEVELDKIVNVMAEYPNMQIELGSHTDSRGSDAYNVALSDRRAKSSAAYIVSKGIDRSRITGKGYGETRLKNKCRNGVKCNEEEHQQNRRTEFIIVKM